MMSVNAPEEAEQAPPALPVAAAPFTGAATGCVVDDPTSGGCLTGHTAHALAEIGRVFGGYRQGPMIRSTACWDEHAWNPSSDHRKGRGCDFWTGPSRQFAAGKALDDGNALVAWLRANADVLGVSYVIWQGRIWSPEKGDRKYTGGGVYDPNDPVGGHWDHIHLSVRR